MHTKILLLTPPRSSPHSMQEKFCSVLTHSLADQILVRLEIGIETAYSAYENAETTINQATELACRNASITMGEAACSLVFALIASPLVLVCARDVARHLNAKLVPIFLDSFESLIDDNLYTSLDRRILRHEYRELMRNCSKLLMTSTVLAQDPQIVSNRNYEIISTHLPWRRSTTWSPPTDANYYRITMLVREFNNGSTLDAFLKALTWLTWQKSSPSIELQIIGNSFDLPLSFNTSQKLSFEITGPLSIEKTIELMSCSNLSYFPIPIKPQLGTIATFDATEIFGLHVAAGVPILLHCHAAFPLVEYVNRFNLGKCYHADKPGQLMELLLSEITTPPEINRLAQSYKNLEEVESERQQSKTELLQSFA